MDDAENDPPQVCCVIRLASPDLGSFLSLPAWHPAHLSLADSWAMKLEKRRDVNGHVFFIHAKVDENLAHGFALKSAYDLRVFDLLAIYTCIGEYFVSDTDNISCPCFIGFG